MVRVVEVDIWVRVGQTGWNNVQLQIFIVLLERSEEMTKMLMQEYVAHIHILLHRPKTACFIWSKLLIPHDIKLLLNRMHKLALLGISPQNTLPAFDLRCSGTDPSAWRSLGTVCPLWTPTSWARSHGHALSPLNYQLAGSTASPSPAFAESEEGYSS